MSCIQVFNGISLKQSEMNFITPTSTNGTIDGPKTGSYQALFDASIIQLHQADPLDTSVLHGDGSNPVVKKGTQVSATPAISTTKEKKS
jgi:hypothetical protein